MKKVLYLLTLCILCCCPLSALAQRVTDGSYRTVAHIKSDGTIQDGSYRTIGHAEGIPIKWVAFYFFFSK